MKRNHSSYHPERKWLIPTIIISLLFITLLLALSLSHSKPSSSSSSSDQPNFTPFDRDVTGSGNGEMGLPKLPRFAYFLTGSKGDVPQLKRVLQAVYHPRNYYLLHLDLEASDAERLELAKYVKSEGVLREFGNVMVVGKADLVTYKGPTMIACTLHGVALLLKKVKDWDWFINLSASDYPLISQDACILSCSTSLHATCSKANPAIVGGLFKTKGYPFIGTPNNLIILKNHTKQRQS